MAPRSLKNQLAYMRHMKKNPGGCGFCVAMENATDQVVRPGKSMSVLRNRFPYSRWDRRTVIDHLMIVPNRHITTMDSFSVVESKEFLSLMSEYESHGYSFYIRSDANKSKSMAHLHGHLIRVA